jgi:hypothetical protein
MKNVYFLLILSVLVPAVYAAPVGSSLVITNNSHYPVTDRTRVAGAALILQHEGEISEPSIPSNAITDPTTNSAINKITTGTPEFVDIKKAPILK